MVVSFEPVEDLERAERAEDFIVLAFEFSVSDMRQTELFGLPEAAPSNVSWGDY